MKEWKSENKQEKMIRIITTILLLAQNDVFSASLSNSLLYQAPDECRWHQGGEGVEDTTLVCQLRTINSELENTNFSVIQPQNTIRLRLECNDALFFQSSISPGSFRPLVELRSLSINYCKIGNLTNGSFTGLRELRNLTIQTHNSDWSSMSLDISSNVFTDELRQLERLDLSANNIYTIPDGLICPLVALEHLNLTQNRIHEIINFHFSAASPQTLHRLSRKCGRRLKTLDLSGNDVDNLAAAIFSGLSQLEHLYLNDNKMTFIADRALEGLVSLNILNLSENDLNNLPPELFNEARNVVELYLQNNSLNVLAPGLFHELKQLVVLDLSRNELTADWIDANTFKQLEKLVYLDLSHNRLEKLEVGIFKHTKLIEILKMQNNLIESLPRDTFAEFSGLRTLILSNNRLLAIDRQTFGQLNQLKLLSLDYNQIARIHLLAFKNLSSLEDLHLNGNKLEAVPEALLHVQQLKTIDLGENLFSNIRNTSLLRLNRIFGLRLTENVIETVERDQFAEMKALQILNLSRNRIRYVEAGAFDNNTNLQAIRLDGNYLRNIKGLFTNLPNLVWLNISDNKLESFDYELIPVGLKWLDIHANRISELRNNFDLESKLSLTTFDISSNQLTEMVGSSIPNSIEIIYLNDNLISKVQSYTFFKKTNITRVDLFGNRIQTLDPNALRISKVPAHKSLPEFYIGGNPIQCDCMLDWLQRNNTAARTHPVLMDVASIYCKLLYNRGRTYVPLVEAKSNQFLCKYEQHCTTLCHCCDFFACDCKMNCPENCTCFHDHSWTSNVVDCSKGDYINELPSQIPMDATQIYLDGNRFEKLISHSFIGRKRLKILFLNGSHIETIQNRTFKGLIELELLHLGENMLQKISEAELNGLDNLQELYLQNNKIDFIANESFSGLNNLRVLRLDSNRLLMLTLKLLPMSLTDLHLSNNPWSCHCDVVNEFYDFFENYTNLVKDKTKTKCFWNDKTFQQLVNETIDWRPFCTNSSSTGDQTTAVNATTETTKSITVLLTHQMEDYVTILIATAISFIVIITISLLICIFHQEMRVWFHSKFGIRLFDHDRDIDKNERDKLFDAFISYSSKDEAFVTEELASVLENGDPRYMLCLHYRDFPVGAYIADTIVQAIESSRRTIMVLSENFIKSEWCRFEFKSAHHQVLRDRRRRLIVILLGELPQKDLDPEIRLYLKTNTYLQWGDTFFWDKLRFALPDVPNNQRNLLHQRTQQNIQSAITSAAALNVPSRLLQCHSNNLNSSRNNRQNILNNIQLTNLNKNCPDASTVTSSSSSAGPPASGGINVIERSNIN